MHLLAPEPGPRTAASRRDLFAVRGLPRPPRAVLFDLDGTLYSQPPVRALMALELGARFLRPSSAGGARRALRTLRAFRRVRESLRAVGRPTTDRLERLQFAESARVAGCDAAEVQALVEEWMYRRPLKYLRMCRRRGLHALLGFLEDRGMRRGVLSDYPALPKLRALGVADHFSPVLCTTEPAINAFKPHPAGFLLVCESWRLPPEDVLYVGDRPAVDAAGARAAGMPCWILGPHPSAFRRLYRALADLCRR